MKWAWMSNGSGLQLAGSSGQHLRRWTRLQKAERRVRGGCVSRTLAALKRLVSLQSLSPLSDNWRMSFPFDIQPVGGFSNTVCIWLVYNDWYKALVIKVWAHRKHVWHKLVGNELVLRLGQTAYCFVHSKIDYATEPYIFWNGSPSVIN